MKNYCLVILFILTLAARAFANQCLLFGDEPRPLVHIAGQRSLLYDRISRSQIDKLPDGTGYDVTLPDSIGVRSIRLPLSTFPLYAGRAENWAYNDENYYFLDVGARHLAHEFYLINGFVGKHLLFGPTVDLEMRFDPESAALVHRSEFLRWRIHEKVLKKYKLSKPYLSEQDFWTLRLNNHISGYSDVFAVFSDPVVEWDRSLDKQLLLTMQIVYPLQLGFSRPTLRGMLYSLGLGFRQYQRLPFEQRLAPDRADSFLESFDARFDRRRTCEINRYAKFVRQLPEPIHGRLLMEVTDRAVDLEMETMVASCDRVTARRFERYGFQEFDRLPTVQESEPEFLCFLHLGDAGGAYRRLETGANEIAVREEIFQ